MKSATMTFQDSCVAHVTPWSVTERSTTLPERIFPAYAGSGPCVISIDASGLQGLNHGAQQAFRCVEDAGDLYVIKHGLMGTQIQPGSAMSISVYNALPLGYMDWEMELDGEKIRSENLHRYATLWSRTAYIDEGKIVTRMRIKDKVLLEIAVIVPFGSSAPLFEIGMTSCDLLGRTVPLESAVRFNIGIRLETRHGKPLFDRVEQQGDSLAIETQGLEAYRLRYGLRHNAAGQVAEYRDGRYGLTWEASRGVGKQTLRCRFLFDDADADADADAGGSGLTAEEAAALEAANRGSWNAFYRAAGDVQGIPAEEAFMLHNSQYLLRAGFDYAQGVPIGSPFNFPWCWSASTFWDSHFVMEAVMKTGDRDNVYRFIEVLYRTVRRTGKPFPWLFMYDGTTTLPDDRDFAPVVMSAHAMTAIKAYSYFPDESLLRERIFPICRTVGDYAVNALFSRREDGRWILSTPVSHDVVEEKAVEVNQTYTIVWFLTVLRKTVEFARQLGVGEELDEKYEHILHGYYVEENGTEYLHARDITAEQSTGASWIPFLLFPTEGKPFLDDELFKNTRNRYDFSDLYMRKQGCYQPWGCFMTASSDFRQGEIERGYDKIREGLVHVFGPGLFSEIGPRQDTVGLPPYVTAHGSFITAYFYQFIADSLWERKLGIFADLPAALRHGSFTVRNAACMGGIKLTASYSTHEVSASLEGSLDGYVVTLPVPPGLEAASLRVWVDGAPVPYSSGAAGRTIEITLAGHREGAEIAVK